MSEDLKDLEYSTHDEERIRDNEEIANMERLIPEMGRRIEICRAKIESIKVDPEYSEDEKKKVIAQIMNSIDLVQRSIKLAERNIGLIEASKAMEQILKEQADEILRRGEHMDPLTADIEQEDEPSRRVN